MLKSEVYELELELTTLCNARCPLCYRNYKSFGDHYPNTTIRSLEDIVEQLESYSRLNYIMLVGSISEPTLYPSLFPLINYIKSRNIRIEICTNGDTNNYNWWKELGKLLSLQDSVYFTICGSTQELHSKYRVNTVLDNILASASALRSILPIDYAQCIKFKYNEEDLDSERFKLLVKPFTNIYMTETFLPKDISNYTTTFNIEDFYPCSTKIDKYFKAKDLANTKFYSTKVVGTADCASLKYHRQQIDVYGNVYPCYLFLEASNNKKWNNNYTEIINMQYSVCKYCDRVISRYCQDNDLHYII